MPDKVKSGSRANSLTPASMDSRDSRKESLDLIEESMDHCDDEEFDEAGEMNVRFKVRGHFLRVNIFAVL